MICRYEEMCLHTTYLVSGKNYRFGDFATALLDQRQPELCHLIGWLIHYGVG